MSPQDARPKTRQAPTGFDSRGMARLALATVLVVVLVLLLVGWLLRPDLGRMPFVEPPDRPVSGVRQDGIERTAAGVRATEEARERLDAYGWADRDEGIATIPIDRAVELYVERQGERGSP
ncbi:MAG: hypothetical protein ACODAG_08695 [Myxococcota bacterium]